MAIQVSAEAGGIFIYFKFIADTMKENQITTERNPLTSQEQEAIAGQDALIESLLALLQLNSTYAGDFGNSLFTGFNHLYHQNRAQLQRLRE